MKEFFFFSFLAAVAQIAIVAHAHTHPPPSVWLTASDLSTLLSRSSHTPALIGFVSKSSTKGDALVSVWAAVAEATSGCEDSGNSGSRCSKKAHDDVVVAKVGLVDCDEEEEVCRQHKLHVLPWIVAFSRGRSIDYHGPRLAAPLLRFMSQLTQSHVTRVESSTIAAWLQDVSRGGGGGGDGGNGKRQPILLVSKHTRVPLLFHTLAKSRALTHSFAVAWVGSADSASLLSSLGLDPKKGATTNELPAVFALLSRGDRGGGGGGEEEDSSNNSSSSINSSTQQKTNHATTEDNDDNDDEEEPRWSPSSSAAAAAKAAITRTTNHIVVRYKGALKLEPLMQFVDSIALSSSTSSTATTTENSASWSSASIARNSAWDELLLGAGSPPELTPGSVDQLCPDAADEKKKKTTPVCVVFIARPSDDVSKVFKVATKIQKEFGKTGGMGPPLRTVVVDAARHPAFVRNLVGSKLEGGEQQQQQQQQQRSGLVIWNSTRRRVSVMTAASSTMTHAAARSFVGEMVTGNARFVRLEGRPSWEE